MKLRFTLTAFALLASAATLCAHSHTWTGAVSGYWSNDANWSVGGAPEPGETDVTLTFPAGAVRYVTTNNIPGLVITDLALNGDYTLAGTGGATLAFGGDGASIVINGSHVSTVASSLPVVLNQGVMFYPNHAAARLTFYSTISGAGGIAQYGPGTLVFSGLNANTYAGTTQVLRGELRFSQANLFPALAVPGRLIVGTDNIAEPALVRLFENHQIANGNVVVINPGGTLALNGNLDTIGELRMTGGAVTMGDGTLTLADDVFYNHSAVSSGIISGRLSLGTATRTFDIEDGTLRIDAIIEAPASAGLIKAGQGILSLRAANTYSGQTTINDGYVEARHAQALGGVGPDSATTVHWPGGLHLPHGVIITNEVLRLMQFAELYASGTCGWKGPVALEGNPFVYVQDAGLCTVDGIVSGSGGLDKEGLGTLRFAGPEANTFLGGLMVRGGTLQLAKHSSVTAIPSSLTVGDGNGPADGHQVVLMSNNQIADEAAIRINDSGLLDVNGWIESLGPITFNGGHLDSGGLFLRLLGDVVVEPRNDAVALIDGRIRLSERMVFDVANGNIVPDLKINAEIVGAADCPLIKTGAGQVYLYNAGNTYDGWTRVNQGTFGLQGGAQPGSALSGTTVSNGASLFLANHTHVANEDLTLRGSGPNGATFALWAAAGTNSWNGPVHFAAQSTIQVYPTNSLLHMNGKFDGLQAFTKAGPGTLRLGGNTTNNYMGTAVVKEGALELINQSEYGAITGAGLIIGDTNGEPASVAVRAFRDYQFTLHVPVTVHASGLLNLNNHPQAFGSLAGAGRVDIVFSRIGLHHEADTTFSGVIGGVTTNNSLAKQAGGRMVLTGNNTYNGTTAVNDGQLFINGQQPNSDVYAHGDGVLQGSGRTGDLFIHGGTLHPGNDGLYGPGLARLTCGQVEFSPGGGFMVDLAGTQPGTNYTQLAVNGTVNLGGAPLRVKIAFASAVSNQFRIVQNDGIDPVSGTFKGLPEGATATFSGVQFRISYVGGTGNDVTLTQLTPMPSPHFGGITRLDNGQLELNGAGIAGVDYVVEGNFDLNTTNWIGLGTITAQPPSGALQFIDVDAPLHPMRFYRFVIP